MMNNRGLSLVSNLLVVLLGIQLASCDCFQKADGMVVDEATQQPLTGVHIYIKTKPDRNTSTDSFGSFHLTNVSGGIGRCPTLKLIFEKPGFQTREIDFDNQNPKTVKLQKF